MNSKRVICMRSIKENVEADLSTKLNTKIILRRAGVSINQSWCKYKSKN